MPLAIEKKERRMLSQATVQRVLAALVAHLGDENDGWMYGFDLMQELSMSSGNLYPALTRLQRGKFVEARDDERPGHPTRRQFRATSNGRVELARLRAEESQPGGLLGHKPGVSPA